jgi:hypothetical protein
MTNIRDPGHWRNRPKEVREAVSLLAEIVNAAETVIGRDPRSRSERAQSRTEHADHKKFADIDATMPDPCHHVAADADVGRVCRMAAP